MNFILIIISVLLNCAAQLLMRKGMLNLGEVGLAQLYTHFWAMLANIWLWLAMFCYGASILFWMIILSKEEVSYAYPLLSMGYIVAALAGYMLFNESLTPMRICGILVICLGVALVTKS